MWQEYKFHVAEGTFEFFAKIFPMTQWMQGLVAFLSMEVFSSNSEHPAKDTNFLIDEWCNICIAEAIVNVKFGIANVLHAMLALTTNLRNDVMFK